MYIDLDVFCYSDAYFSSTTRESAFSRVVNYSLPYCKVGRTDANLADLSSIIIVTRAAVRTAHVMLLFFHNMHLLH